MLQPDRERRIPVLDDHQSQSLGVTDRAVPGSDGGSPARWARAPRRAGFFQDVLPACKRSNLATTTTSVLLLEAVSGGVVPAQPVRGPRRMVIGSAIGLVGRGQRMASTGCRVNTNPSYPFSEFSLSRASKRSAPPK